MHVVWLSVNLKEKMRPCKVKLNSSLDILLLRCRPNSDVRVLAMLQWRVSLQNAGKDMIEADVRFSSVYSYAQYYFHMVGSRTLTWLLAWQQVLHVSNMSKQIVGRSVSRFTRYRNVNNVRTEMMQTVSARPMSRRSVFIMLELHLFLTWEVTNVLLEAFNSLYQLHRPIVQQRHTDPLRPVSRGLVRVRTCVAHVCCHASYSKNARVRKSMRVNSDKRDTSKCIK